MSKSRRFLERISLDAAAKLPTPRLLAYYKSRRSFYNHGACDCCGEFLSKADEDANRVAREYMDVIKAMLNSRENV